MARRSPSNKEDLWLKELMATPGAKVTNVTELLDGSSDEEEGKEDGGLVTTPEGDDTSSPVAEVTPATAMVAFMGDVPRRGISTALTTAYERRTIEVPRLTSLKPIDIRTFLSRVDEYQAVLKREGRTPEPMRQWIDESIRGGMPRFVRSNAGAVMANQLPPDSALGKSDPWVITYTDDKLVTTTVELPVLDAWDHIVRYGFKQFLQKHVADMAADVNAIERQVSQKLRWNDTISSYAEAEALFIADFEKLNQELQIRKALPDGGETGKSLCRLLTHCLRPAELQKRVSEKIRLKGINSYDGWFDLVQADFAGFYEGLVRGAKSAAAAMESKPPMVRQPLAGEGFKNSAAKQWHSVTEGSNKRAVKWDGKRKQTHEHAKAADSSEKKAKNGLPPDPCRHCGGMHWSFNCTKRSGQSQFNGPKGGAGGPQQGHKKRVSSHGNHAKAKQVTTGGEKDQYDGTVVVGKVPLRFLIDTGASKTFVNATLAEKMLRTAKGAERVNLDEVLKVDTASATLDCNFKVVAPATLFFNGGEVAELKLIELYAVQNMRGGEVLLGRNVLKNLGIDVVELLKQAVLTTNTDSLPAFVQEMGSEESFCMTQTAKRMTVQAPVSVITQDEPRAVSQEVGQTAMPVKTTATASRTPPCEIAAGASESKGPLPTTIQADNPKRADAKRATHDVLEPAEHSASAEADESMPEIAKHDPATVIRVLEERLKAALGEGLSERAVARLRKFVLEEVPDLFRTVLSNDPPAKVKPIKVQFLPGVYRLKKPDMRRYTALGSKAMAQTMLRLETYRYVYRNPMATVVSPAYPVKKPHVDSSAPLEDQFRLTVDLRAVNSETVPVKYPLPRLETFMLRVAGKRFFGTLDLFSGYWQLPLDEESQPFFSIMTDAGVWTPYRLIQGSRNAAGPFQAAVSEALGDLLNDKCVVYIDDILIMGATEEEFIENWLAVLKRLDEVGFKVSAKKTNFYAQRVKYCGRVFTPDGAQFDDNFVRALTEMAVPQTGADLQSYTASANWLRSAVPRFAERIEPLQQLLNKAMAECKGSAKRKLQGVRLVDVGWRDDVHLRAFRDVNNAVAQHTKLAYPDDEKIVCVVTDASDTHWAGIVTQVASSERDKPFLEQQHEPLAFVSGAFRGSSLAWPTIEKEGYGIVETCLRCEHILKRCDGFEMYTDHSNLAYILSPDPSVFSTRRQAADRVERWRVLLQSFTYRTQHIEGKLNVMSDLLTRWGVPKRGNEVAAVAVTRSRSAGNAFSTQQPVNGGAGSEPPVAASTESTPRAAPVTTAAPDATVSPTTMPTATTVARLDDEPQLDASASLRRDMMLEFNGHDQPDIDEIQIAQRTVKKLDVARLDLVRADVAGRSGVLVNRAGKVFVPDTRHLRLRLFVVAHQAMGGHRAIATTLAWLQEHFWWPTMESDVQVMGRSCLHCLRTKGGKAVPRPLLHGVVATAPNEVIHFDYLFIRKPTTGRNTPPYVLTLIDGFSRFVWLVPCMAADAATTANALLNWFSLFGIVRTWVSDRGTHFMNEVMSELRTRLGSDQHFTAPRAPWSNGLVERANRSIRETLSALRSETRLSCDEWPLLLPIVNSVLNNTPSKVLGGKAPITAFMGRAPGNPLDAILHGDKTIVTVPLTAQQVANQIAALERTLSEFVQAQRDTPRGAHKRRPGEKAVDFDIGDFVLTSRVGKELTDKTAVIWEGPALVVDAENSLTFTVKDLIHGKTRTLHAQHLKRYADGQLVVTPQLKEFVAAATAQLEVRAIVSHRKVGRSDWELEVTWVGFEDDDTSWEPLQRLYEDVPNVVRTYVNAIEDRKERLLLLKLLH